MIRIHFLLFLLLFVTNISFGQNKGVVLQNIWNNDLNDYNPRSYFDKLFSLLKDKLGVDIAEDTKSLQTPPQSEDWNKSMQSLIKERIASGNSYFIAVASDLRLPALNLGKFLFKDPPRSSKLTFTLHIYDTAGTQILGDTVINRGCVIKTVDAEKGNKYFYFDYNSFMNDMQCHLDVIKKILQEKPLAKKQKNGIKIK